MIFYFTFVPLRKIAPIFAANLRNISDSSKYIRKKFTHK